MPMSVLPDSLVADLSETAKGEDNLKGSLVDGNPVRIGWYVSGGRPPDGPHGGRYYGGPAPGKPTQPHPNTQPVLTYVAEGGEWNYYATFVYAAGERIVPPGMVTMVTHIWANDELIFDAEAGTKMERLRVKFFDGNEEQGEVYDGMHYRGLFTLLFEEMPLKAFNDSIPRIEVVLITVPAETEE